MLRKRAIALGTFDGLHRGHMQVLSGAKQSGFRPAVLLFSEHPASVLTKKAPPMLCTPEKRDALLESAGMELLHVDFREILSLSPRAFFEEILLKRFSAGLLSCGENYTFGKDRAGTPETLQALCSAYGVQLHVAETVQFAGAPISSTRIRQALKNGEIEQACNMLGRPFSYAFPVVKGDCRGRTLQFPTINQFFPESFVQPKFGVYASLSEIDGIRYPAVTNFGARPTIGTKTVRSETYLLGFSGDLYGKCPEVQWLSYLRPEQKFASLEELQAAIEKDAARAQEIFKNTLANDAQTL